MTVPWVSIITPVYNGVEFLKECAMSVCLQNCKDKDTEFTWEWWIGINGHGETGGVALKEAEELRDICSNYIGDNKIHVVNLPGVRGKVAASNELVARSTGEWIAVLDCDDTWERNKLLYQKIFIEKYPTPIHVIGTFCTYFGDMRGIPKIPAGILTEKDIWESNPIINSSAILRREYAHWEDRFLGLDDYDLWLRLCKKGLTFFNIHYTLVNHRVHANSAFNAKGVQDLEGLKKYHAET
jgi:glycosyltransferase involved in cell wall biosynthesis